MGHYVVLCKHCNAVITQCRCMASDKMIRYDICNKCKTGDGDSPSLKLLKEAVKKFNGSITRSPLDVAGGISYVVYVPDDTK